MECRLGPDLDSAEGKARKPQGGTLPLYTTDMYEEGITVIRPAVETIVEQGIIPSMEQMLDMFV